MATQSSVRIVFNNFGSIASGLQSNASKAVQETAQGIASKAQASAPVITGTLRSSIQASSSGSFSWRVVASAEYAMFVEFGTGRGPAQPFLFPAAHTAEPELISKLTSYLAV